MIPVAILRVTLASFHYETGTFAEKRAGTFAMKRGAFVLKIRI
jgi:hypothetical protein